MTGGLILLRRQMRAAATKNIVDWGVRRQQTLGLARRLASPRLGFPLPDGFVRHKDAAAGHQLFDVPKTHGKPEIQPHRMVDDLRRIAEADVQI